MVRISIEEHKKQKGGAIYDRIVNKLLPNAKYKLRDGERHAILYTKNGFQPASFMGPNTAIMNKIRDGVKPITKSDRTSLAHDLRYSLAKTPKEIRAADIKMINKLNKIQKNKSDYRFNIYMGRIPIQAKMLLEDLGIAKPTTFTTFGDIPESDIPLARKTLDDLEQHGYGKVKMKKKKSKWMEHVAACRALHPNTKYKEVLKISSKTYNKS